VNQGNPGDGSPGPGAPLVHIHIPKTAGSTFNGILRRQFPASDRFELPAYFNDSSPGDAKLAAAGKDKSAVFGHLDFRCVKHLPEESLYISFLREPAARVISGYHNILRDTSNPAHQAVSGLSLEDYLASGIVRDVDNGQVRRLAGVGMEVPFGDISEEHLQMARRNISTSNYLTGLTERFDESLLLLAEQFGGEPWHYLRLNSGGYQARIAPLTASAQHRLNACNVFDQRLALFRQRQRRFNIIAQPARLAERMRNRLRQALA
jgi:hypothetical protein